MNNALAFFGAPPPSSAASSQPPQQQHSNSNGGMQSRPAMTVQRSTPPTQPQHQLYQQHQQQFQQPSRYEESGLFEAMDELETFETLDLNANNPPPAATTTTSLTNINGTGGGSRNSRNNNNNTHGITTITPMMMTGAKNTNNFVVSSSSGPENFSPQHYLNNSIHPHLQQQQQQDNTNNFRDDGTFEYEGGVALQTALNVFGSVASAAGGLAGGLLAAGGLTTSTPSSSGNTSTTTTNYNARIMGMGIGGGTTTKNLVGNVATWGGRIVDVVAPTTATTTTAVATMSAASNSSLGMARGAGVGRPAYRGGSPVVHPHLPPQQQQHVQQQQVPMALQSHHSQPPSPSPVYLHHHPPSTPTMQFQHQQQHRRQSSVASNNSSEAHELFGAAPTTSTMSIPQQTIPTPMMMTAAEVGGHARQPSTGSGISGGGGEGGTHGRGGSASDFFASSALPSLMDQQPRQRFTSGTAGDFFNAPPTPTPAETATSTTNATYSNVTPTPTAIMLNTVSTVTNNMAPTTTPAIFLPTDTRMVGSSITTRHESRQRQLSHRLSSLEKATHDSTFQYADPLEGGVGVVTASTMDNNEQGDGVGNYEGTAINASMIAGASLLDPIPVPAVGEGTTSAEKVTKSETPVTSIEILASASPLSSTTQKCQQEPHSPSMTNSSSEKSSSITATRPVGKIQLPSPSKAIALSGAAARQHYLPLPPPLPVRKKTPITSTTTGDHTPVLFPSGTIEKPTTTFRKPPPIPGGGGGSNTSTPRFHVPSPRVSPRTLPMTAAPVTTPSSAMRGAERRALVGGGNIGVGGGGDDGSGTTRLANSLGEGRASATTSPAAGMPLTPATPDEVRQTLVGTVPSQHGIGEVNGSSLVSIPDLNESTKLLARDVKLAPSPGLEELSDSTTTQMNASLIVGGEEVRRTEMDFLVPPPPDTSSVKFNDDVDWNSVTDSMAKVDDTVHKVDIVAPPPFIPPEAVTPHLDSVTAEPHAFAISPTTNTTTAFDAQPETNPDVFYSSTSPPIYPNNEFPRTPSSRVTECDVMSDYQMQVCEEDFPDVLLPISGSHAGSDVISDVEVEEEVVTNSSVLIPSTARVDNEMSPHRQHQHTTQLLATPSEYIVQPSMALETDHVNGSQDAVPENVVPSSLTSVKVDNIEPLNPVTNVENPPDGKHMLLPKGWAECFDTNTGRTYFFNETAGISSWERPTIDDLPFGDDVVEDEDNFNGDICQPPIADVGGEFTGKDTIESVQPEADTLQQEDATEEETLPEGWEKGVDPTTDKVYYFHPATGISSWDYPSTHQQDEGCGETTDDDQQVLSESHQASMHLGDATMVDAVEAVRVNTPTIINNKEEEIHATSSGLECSALKEDCPMPEGWTVPCEQIPGETFYCNESLGGSQRHRSTLVIEKDAFDELLDGHILNDAVVNVTPGMESTVPQSVTEEDEPSNLPPNKDLDQLLESSSTNHADQINAAIFQSDDILVSAVPSDSLGYTDDAATHLSFESLPPGWIEAIDYDTGLTYYYNEESNETSWDRPIGNVNIPKKMTIDDAAVNGESVDASNHLLGATSEGIVQDEGVAHDTGANEGSSHLQQTESHREDDWTEVTDPDSGTVYYYNPITNETSWTKPEQKLARTQSSNEVNDSGEEIVEDIGSKVVVDAQNVTKELLTSAEAIDEGWTQVDHSPPSSSKDVVEIAGDRGDRLEASDDGLLPLPGGWKELVDPNTAEVYYYNELSGATSWTLPEHSLTEGLGEFKQGIEEEKDSCERDIAVIAAETLECEINAADNSLVSDQALGHRETDEVNERFKANAPRMTIRSIPQESKDNSLPEGWMQGTDPSSGETYYFNESTGESSWDRPALSDDGTAEEAYTGAGVSHVSLLAEGSYSAKVKKSSDAPTPTPPLDSSLSDGWVKVKDTGSGGMYFYNEKTGETTWDRPVQTRQSSKISSKADRLRPAHAIATFGFGGRLCIMIPQVAATLSGAVTERRASTTTMRRGPVVIHRICNLIRRDHVHSIPSPATPSTPLVQTEEEGVLSYLKKKCSDPEDLLWNVIDIAARNDGKLRSDKKAQEAIVDLLLASNSGEGANGGRKKKDQVALESSASNFTELQDLLIRGQRESAVDEAIAQENYALALLIASMCDRNTYRMTARCFADKMLPVGSPLHTVALLFSDNVTIPDDEELLDPYGKRAPKRSHWYDDEMFEDLGQSWKEHLASILCNRKDKWEKIVLSLGDRLLQLGHCHAAHVCYLVSSSSFGSPSRDTTRLVLIGCDHRRYMNQLLMTPQSIQSFERTEAFEWARRRGNRNSHIPSLQPFKLRYAELLADFGREELARAYLLSIRSSIGLGSDTDRRKTSSGNTRSAMMKDAKFIEALERLDDRICVSTGSERTLWNHNEKSKESATSLAFSIVKSVLVKKPKADEPMINLDASDNDDLSPRELGPSLPEPGLPGSGLLREPIQEPRKSHADIVVESTPPGGEERSIIAKNSFDRAGLAIGNGTSSMSSSDRQGPPSSAPPVFEGYTMKKDVDVKSMTTDEDERRKDVIPPTPRQAGKNDEKTKAPVSEPPRSAGWLSKLLRRDGESKATVADVGEEMQAYYDEKLKRWIFPGDDPAEVAKPLAPPPIVPKTPVAPTPSAPTASNDPLAALMAPPPSRGLSTMKRGASAAGRFADPMASTGKKVGTSSVGDKKIPPTSPLMAAPPTFAVFQPKPTPTE